MKYRLISRWQALDMIDRFGGCADLLYALAENAEYNTTPPTVLDSVADLLQYICADFRDFVDEAAVVER